MSPRFHCTPPEAVAETVRETVFVGDHTFRIDRPADSDQLLNHPWCRSAYVADQYVPYWPTLWPSARMLAKAVLREPWENYPQRSGKSDGSACSAVLPVDVLEVGCGLGLAGVACLTRGLRVTFSDVDETALTYAAANARINGYPDGFRTRLLDFRCPPDDVKYPVVIGSDLMYEERMVDPLVHLLEAVLAPGGVCLIADPDRMPARVFKWKLQEVGYEVTADFARAGEPGGERTKGTIYRIRWNG